MKTTLVIMAAGIGSRFGGGIKQLAPVGLNGEIIMDYSIHDAIEAGFNKIVFIIRKDIKDAFKEAIGNRIEKICKDLDVEIAYAYQELNELPKGVELPTGRTKPWGTGQAVLACKEVLHEPFAVINADDYYGKEAFVKPESLITHVGDRKGHDMRYAIDPTKIHNELGWLPETKFEDGIKKTIQWYLDNREWWETIISGEYQNYYEKMYSNR